ncbi:hypothetical protein [Paenibacillus sp. PAMC21692]|uniref:hypothetical protein n=1 Tax=Paenibacillus sp. PAMC21692 TaxID=2762320 RepID=UPI00164D872B|nr:hypothetical protein [Paenibacillus sp. PAMC21692]QNK57174.1 hypothetical protein H7F31_32630 [Paenibacillus sp. PAMC21692]
MRGSYKGKRSLISGVVILMLIITATACTKPEDKMFEETDFAAMVETVGTGTWKVNEDIEITTGLINLTNRSAAVYHASPLIHVQIYDERDQPRIEMHVTDDIGINGIAKPNETYNPDNEIYESGKRIIQIEQPGTYTLVATATFEVKLNGDRRQSFRIVSEPFEIRITES